MEAITLADVGMFVAFLVALISGIGFLKKNLKEWVTDAVKPEMDSLHTTMDTLQTSIDTIQEDRLRDKADEARRQILLFNDELLRGVKHSKEHFDNVLLDVNEYTRYCNRHAGDYENAKCVLAIEEIKRCYQICEAEGKFL